MSSTEQIDLCKDIESASLAYSNYIEQKRLVALAQTAYEEDSEQKRLVALAQTDEEAAMRAVKAATTKK
jgi:hypothetical protein